MFTAIIIILLTLLPLLIPATITAFHAVSDNRRRRTHSRATRSRVGYAVDPIPVSA